MSDYTPDEQEFIGAWVSAHSEEGWGGPVDVEGRPLERISEARRGIAKAKADALREAADALPKPVGLNCNKECHDADWASLRVRADRIEGGANEG
ncbi:hypothetical protein [Brevibacterium zhoupengii]|uniref:hypothetical protein n=1 Tax=Brevibacterium zhoupengii TaxID=2898795 RepID=UPI001F09BA7F|nr:hypothetical protein [Brevibacterium zhoupengii]